MRINLDRTRLAGYKLTVQDVEDALRRQNAEIPAGRIESTAREFTVVAETDVRTPEQFGNIIVANVGGYPVRIRDVGSVAIGAVDERTISRYKGNPSLNIGVAGIAGFILSVGMAVDANILIFERMKEELRVGKSLNAALEGGFTRAWNSIFDSNVSSLITAFILFWFGSSVIRGFALVLIIGVLVSMFTAITVSRTVLRFGVVTCDWARRPWMYGITEEEFLAARPVGRPVRGEARGRV